MNEAAHVSWGRMEGVGDEQGRENTNWDGRNKKEKKKKRKRKKGKIKEGSEKNKRIN